MGLRLRSVAKQFLSWAEIALKPNTVLSYRYQLGKFLKATKNKMVEDLAPADLTRSARTWHEFQAVVRCFNWATTEAKIIRVNPFSGVDLPPRDQRKRILLPRELARLIRSCRGPARNLVLAIRETFSRPQEMRLVRWPDLVSEDPELPIEEALRQGRAIIVLQDFKDRSRRRDPGPPRVLLVSSRLGRLLLRLLALRKDPEQHIFLNARTKPWSANAVRCLFRRLRKRLGIEPDRRGETIVCYSIRHSQATLAAAKGLRDRVLADILGHVETRTTARYCHLQVGHLREALERLAAERVSQREKRKRNALGPNPASQNPGNQAF